MNKSKIKVNLFFSVLILLLLAGLVYLSFNDEKGLAEGEDSVSPNTPEVETVRLDNFQEEEVKLSSVGQVEALQEINIRSQVSSEVNRILVDIGDQVERGELLMELDGSELRNELEAAEASIQRLENELAQIKAGPSEERKRSALSSVEQAESGLDQAKAQLEQARVSSESMIKNAKIGVDLARSSLDSSSVSSEQQLKDAYESLRLVSSNILPTVWTALVVSGDILGKDPGDKRANEAYDYLLGARNRQFKRDAERAHDRAKESYFEAKDYRDELSQDITEDEGEELERLISRSLDDIDETLENLRFTLDNTVTSDDLPRTSTTGVSLQGLKQEVDGQISYINQAQSSLQTQRQSIKNAQISDSSSREQAQLNYEQALQQLDSAQKEAEANLETARASVRSQEKSLVQARNSYQELIAPPREVDLGPLRSSIREAEARKRSIQDRLDDIYIRAPFKGEIGSMPLRKGDLVSPGDLLTSLANRDGIQVRSSISSQDKRSVKIGSQVSVDGFIEGFVSRISSQVDPMTGKLELVVAIVEGGENLVIGESVGIKIETEQDKGESLYLLPFQSIETTSEGSFVFVVNDSGEVERKQVELGRVVNNFNEVRSDLSPETEIIRSVRGLSPGQKVNVK